MNAATWIEMVFLVLAAAGYTATAIYMRRMAKLYRVIVTNQQRAIDAHTESVENIVKSLGIHSTMIRALQVRGAR